MNKLARALRTGAYSEIDLRGLAQVLQSVGRRGDTILAHISPKEAARLKRDGGSGTINPVSGLPEFAELPDYTPPPVEDFTTQPPVEPGGSYPVLLNTPAQQQDAAFTPTVSVADEGVRAREAASYTPAVPAGPSPITAAPPPQVQPPSQVEPPDQKPKQEPKQGLIEKAMAALQDPATLAKLGLGLGGVGLGISQQSAARKQAAQAQSQLEALGKPYQAQGQEMIAAAQRGELTPQSQQAYQAAQAQVQQGIAARGGVGAQQAAAVLGNVYNQLLQNQYTLGMSTAQIGDQYARMGIQAGLQADQNLQNTTANYYATLMRMFGGMPGTTATPPATPTR